MSSDIHRLLAQVAQHIESTSQSPSSARPKSRQGKRAVVAHVDPAVGWQLKKLALDRQATVQGLLEEALDDLFEKYHLPRITAGG